MALTEKRIQVYLPSREYLAIKKRAQKEGKSLAQLLREAAAQYLRRTPEQAMRDGYRKLMEGVGVCRDDGAGASQHHDKYLGSGGW